MKVENVIPGYKNAQEREKSIQDAYTELQIIFYNKTEDKKNGIQNKQQKNE